MYYLCVNLRFCMDGLTWFAGSCVCSGCCTQACTASLAHEILLAQACEHGHSQWWLACSDDTKETRTHRNRLWDNNGAAIVLQHSVELYMLGVDIYSSMQLALYFPYCYQQYAVGNNTRPRLQQPAVILQQLQTGIRVTL